MHPPSSLAMIVLGLAKKFSFKAVVYIYAKSIQLYVAMKKISDHQTGVFANVFGFNFSAFPFTRLLACTVPLKS